MTATSDSVRVVPIGRRQAKSLGAPQRELPSLARWRPFISKLILVVPWENRGVSVGRVQLKLSNPRDVADHAGSLRRHCEAA